MGKNRLMQPANFSRYRWRICALLFFATTVNYIDRQVIGLLKPALMTDLHWNEIDFGNVQAAFNAARKTALLVCAVCGVPVFMAGSVANLWTATILIGIAAAAHQGFSANL